MANDSSKKSSGAINVVALVSECLKQINEGEKRMGHVNIIIAGKTGVGKSTLINAAFRENLAETGMGLPVTQSSKVIEMDGLPIRIYDTVGLELTEKTKRATIDDIHGLIRAKLDENNPDGFIHCMWYCVQANSDRLELPEQELIADIAKKIPVVLVITKAYLKKHAREFAAVLKGYNLAVKSICIVLAQSYSDEDFSAEAYGVEELIQTTLKILPESAKDAWINAQSSIEIKHRQAVRVINETVAAAFGAGFIPLPVADVLMLMPIQISMMVRITNIYGLKITRNKMKRILFIIFGAMGAASAGTFFARTLFTGIAKLIPGVGTLAGGTINGTAASAMTMAIGRVYIFIMEKLLTGEMTESDFESPEGIAKIKEILSSAVNFNFKSHNNDEEDYDASKPRYLFLLVEEPPNDSIFTRAVKGISGILKLGRGNR